MAENNEHEQPWGTNAVPLPASEYDLDEDGVIYVKKRLTVRDMMYGQGDPEDAYESTVGMLRALIAGWRISYDGREVEYSPETIGDLPIDMLALVTKYLPGPLGEETNGTKRSGRRQRKSEQAKAN